MSRIRRFSSFVILVLFLFGQVFALDWQGMAARSPAGEFPAGGLYAASSAFPVNSLVDITNPATGKTIRVIVLKSQADSRLLLTLSSDAAAGLGLPSNGTASVRAAQVPLPTGFGTDYSDELRYSSDPDLYPVDRNPSEDSALAKAGEEKPAAPVVVEPVAPVSEQTTPVTVAQESKPELVKPVAEPLSNTIVESPEPAVPEVVETAPILAPAIVAKPADPEVIAPALAPLVSNTPKAAGIKSGIGEFAGSSLSTGSVGEMQKPASSPPSQEKPLTTVPASGGLAQGLGSFTRSKEPLNPGDVSRPEQSIWLANSSASSRIRPGSGLAEPRLGATELVSGPEANQALTPGLAAKPSFVLVDPRVRYPVAAEVSPQAQDEGLLYHAGAGMYGRQLADAKSRSVVRPLGVFLDGDDSVDSFALVSAPPGTLAGSELPLARTGKEEYPDGSSPWLAAPGSVVAGADGLPLARTGKEEYPDGSSPWLAAPGSVVAGADGLPLARTGKEEYPDGSSPWLAAPGSVASGADGLPLARAETLDGFNPWLAAPGTGLAAAGNLPEALVAGKETADGGFVRPEGSVLSIDSSLPEAGQPAWDTPDYLGGTVAGTNPLVSELPEAGIASEARPEVPTPAGYADSMILGPVLIDPQAQLADGGTNLYRPGETVIAGELKDPSAPVASTVDASAPGTRPDPVQTGAVLPGPGTNADNSPSVKAPAESPATGELALVKPKEDPKAIVVKPADTVLDPRVDAILSYLEPTKPAEISKPVEPTKPVEVVRPVKPVTLTEGLSPALVASLKDYEWARGNLPIVAKLEKKSYYVQVGSFANPKSAGDTIKGLAKGHPVVVLPESAGSTGLYKLFVGPLKEDEKGLILYWFRSKGYRDAYIREGAPN